MIHEFTDLVTLPSKGLYYPENHPFHNKSRIPFRGMLVSDEALLMNHYYLKTGTIEDKLFSNVTNIPDLQVDELLAGDVASLFYSLYVQSYGRMVEVETVCRHCNATVKANFMIDFLIRVSGEEPVRPFENRFAIMLPQSGIDIALRFPTHGDYKKIAKNQGKLSTALMNTCIVSVNGNENKKLVHEIVSRIPLGDAQYIRSFFDEHEPGVISKFKYFCDSCGQNNDAKFGYGYEMFGITPEKMEQIYLETSFLLSYYHGESWNSVWNWPVAVRKWAIERVSKEINRANEEQNANAIPTKGSHHNTPDIRQLTGMTKDHSPNAKMQRFT